MLKYCFGASPLPWFPVSMHLLYFYLNITQNVPLFNNLLVHLCVWLKPISVKNKKCQEYKILAFILTIDFQYLTQGNSQILCWMNKQKNGHQLHFQTQLIQYVLHLLNMCLLSSVYIRDTVLDARTSARATQTSSRSGKTVNTEALRKQCAWGMARSLLTREQIKGKALK